MPSWVSPRQWLYPGCPSSATHLPTILGAQGWLVRRQEESLFFKGDRLWSRRDFVDQFRTCSCPLWLFCAWLSWSGICFSLGCGGSLLILLVFYSLLSIKPMHAICVLSKKSFYNDQELLQPFLLPMVLLCS